MSSRSRWKLLTALVLGFAALGVIGWQRIPPGPVTPATITLTPTGTRVSASQTTVVPSRPIEWIRITQVKPVDYYLSLLYSNGTSPYGHLYWELRKLPDITNATAVAKITYLALNATNPEVKEAFELMIKGGTPDLRNFSYAVPEYNTELQVLYWLACQNEFKTDDTLALAIAMVNGIWITIGDDQVRDAVKTNATDLLAFFRETDELQGGVKAPQLSRYPLEAMMSLVWTAGQNLNNGPHSLFSSNPWFRDRPQTRIDIKDYEWNTLSVQGLRKARQIVQNKSWNRNDYASIFLTIEGYFASPSEEGGPNWVGGWPGYKTKETTNVHGEKVPINNINNPDFEIEYLIKTGKGIGTCDDQAIMMEALCKSWGIATTTIYRMWGGPGDVGHTHAICFDPKRRIWFGSSGQLGVNKDRTDRSNQVTMYLARPPWNQHHVLEWTPDPFVPSYHMSKLCYVTFRMTAQQVYDSFSTGVSVSAMKQWLLYS
jgi:hypothetical protein